MHGDRHNQLLVLATIQMAASNWWQVFTASSLCSSA